MKNFIFIGLLLVSAPGWACDSYEDCMEPKSNGQKCLDRYKFDDYKGNPQKILNACFDSSGNEEQPNYLKAIAYKMDEISKKLDEQNSTIISAQNATAMHGVLLQKNWDKK